MKRLTTALASALLLGALATGAPGVAHAGPGSGTSTAPVGSADMYLSDCLWGPFGPEPVPGIIEPAVVKSQNCVAVTLYTGEDTFEGGSAQINLPAGITISKKIAGPSGGLVWSPPSGCAWSGSFSVLASGKAQTLRLNNIWCGPDDSLVAYFSARIANPADVDYMPFTFDSRMAVWHQYYEVGDSCWIILTGFPYLFGASYQYTGSYVPVKYGPAYQLDNANVYTPMPFLVAPDNDFYRWWQWLFAELGGCFS
ncbi:MAG: hypothetical protein ACO3C1_09350 [Ilumatobacteraceae bacterium]